MHNNPLSGHLGSPRTLHRAQQEFYWLRICSSTTQQYVASCLQFQRHTPPTSAPPGVLHPATHYSSSFETVGIDLLGPFPKSANGNRWAVVCANLPAHYSETAALPLATVH